MYIQVSDIVTGEIVKTFLSFKDLEEWMENQENPTQYDIAVYID